MLEGTATAQPALPNTFTTVTINSAEGSGGAPAQLQRLARFQTSLKLGLTGEGGQWAPQGSASSGSSGNNDVSESSSSQGTVSGGGQQQQQAPAQESLGLKAHQQQATGAYESLDSAVDGASELAGGVTLLACVGIFAVVRYCSAVSGPAHARTDVERQAVGPALRPACGPCYPHHSCCVAVYCTHRPGGGPVVPGAVVTAGG